jgi:hypothetical protein
MTKAIDLAARFERANHAFVALIEGLASEDWNAICFAEGWSVGVTAHHIAAGYAATLHYVPAMMAGDMPPVTWDMLHQANEQHAGQFGDVSRAETLDLLRADGERVSAWLNSLGADDLAQTIALPLMGDEPVSLQTVIEAFVIGHIGMHRASIEAAL